MTFPVTSLITLHLVNVNKIIFPLSAIFTTLRIVFFSPLTNKASIVALVLLILDLPYPRTFAKTLVPRITLP